MPPASQTGKKTPRSLAASVNKLFAAKSADMGYGGGGPWPGEPNTDDYTCTVRGWTVDPEAEFEYNVGKEKKKIPAVSFQFQYTYRDAEGKVLDFDGERLIIPYEVSGLPETDNKSLGGKQQTRVGIAASRLKGLMTGLLGAEPDDIGAAQEQIDQMFQEAVDNSTEIEAVVNCQYTDDSYVKNGKSITFKRKKDFIRELVGGPAGGEELPPEEDQVEELPPDQEPEPEPEPTPKPAARRAAPAANGTRKAAQPARRGR